jgi:rRNA maturation endonuclease Nob1
MVYVCESCRFVFERTGDTDDCPDCGRPDIREASEEECAEYRKNRAEIGKVGNGKARQ